ncbi:hypothetical protein THMIRHAM_04830 [Thiomicrorhabdus immobilis]|uniref:Capsule polysaccharide biosynthesis protein n=1 Tax=Thiomicrorhabdus immobilis TaxID=2791037 RepID=A0ABN6CUR0_9GAMM|nr:hypothetical protein [Thiomicrorhabdus immobilis]BCN92698.1 hypothetical protein THMIRHAM_04830 [Thiomicrorhabdus immobilis]
MKSVAFVANYQKTIFFHKIAEKLTEKGIKIYWVSVSKTWTDYLLEQGVHQEEILFLPRSISKQNNSALGDFKLNELIYSDRVLRHETIFGQNYLTSIQKPVYDFIVKNKISIVFGEITWAHEVLINRMCNSISDLNCQYLKPHTIRIPNGRFAFFKDEYEKEIYEVESNPAHPVMWDFELKKPDYFHLNNLKNSLTNRIKGILKKITLVFHKEKNDFEDPTQRVNKFQFLINKAQEEINFYLYRFFVKKLSYGDLPEKFWVYYLHKQPEASIDVIGRYYEDQLKNIYWLARQLPDDCFLLVKEHTNAIGDRSPSFFRKISGINRVELIDESIDSYTLIKKSRKTSTVSGTVAYEAALLGKDVILFSNAFFSSLPTIQSVSQDLSLNKKTIDQFKAYIFANSFEGIISDPLSDERCIEQKNIDKITFAFMCVLNHG